MKVFTEEEFVLAFRNVLRVTSAAKDAKVSIEVCNTLTDAAEKLAQAAVLSGRVAELEGQLFEARVSNVAAIKERQLAAHAGSEVVDDAQPPERAMNEERSWQKAARDVRAQLKVTQDQLAQHQLWLTDSNNALLSMGCVGDPESPTHWARPAGFKQWPAFQENKFTPIPLPVNAQLATLPFVMSDESTQFVMSQEAVRALTPMPANTQLATPPFEIKGELVVFGKDGKPEVGDE